MRVFLLVMTLSLLLFSGCASEKLRGLPPASVVRPSAEELAIAEAEADAEGKLLPPPKDVIVRGH